MTSSSFNPLTWFGFNKPVAPATTSSASSSPASSAPPVPAPVPLSAASSISPAPRSTDSTTVPAPTTPSLEPGKKNIYFKSFKECFTKPDETVLKHPIKSTVYHVAIQILFYSVAQSFPIFGAIVIAFSAALFERVVVLNPKKYGNAIVDSLKDAWNYISESWNKNKVVPAASAASETPSLPPAPIDPTSTIPAPIPASALPSETPPTVSDLPPAPPAVSS